MSDEYTPDTHTSCPFCDSVGDYHHTTDHNVAQHSHTATDRHHYECDACGYRRESVWRGNARTTSHQPWRRVRDAEQMPDRYCLMLCTACNAILGRAEIGEWDEVHPETRSSKCCSAPLTPAYTFHEVPNRTPLRNRRPYWIALRLIYPHVTDITQGQMDADPRTVFETKNGFVIRVATDTVETSNETRVMHASTTEPHLIESKLANRLTTTVRRSPAGTTSVSSPVSAQK